MLVNASLVPSASVGQQLQALWQAGRPGIVWNESRVAAAVLKPDSPAPPDNGCVEEMGGYLTGLNLPPLEAHLPLLEYPHDVVRHHMTILGENLDHRLRQGSYREIADGLFVAEDVQLGQYLVTDTRKGPIVLERGSTIGPYCYLSGPAHVGAQARVIEHAALKDGVALGHTTKIGGEVEASIIESYTNKQHHGFLGHSYLGSWINLGAGTCNSDLKNTYGQVNMEYHSRKVATGMQFLGCIMGDYAKTAINTGIFTGKTIGVCSMLYGFVTTNVPSFVNYARLFGQVTETPVDVMIATQARMFARRNVTQRPHDVQLLQDMYRLTQRERQISGEPLAF
jgi:glucose-1-phosphate thymidylyltransferase